MSAPTTRRMLRERTADSRLPEARPGDSAATPGGPNAVSADAVGASVVSAEAVRASAVPARTAAVRRGPGRALGDLLLWIAAAAGALCIVLVVLAFTSNITLIMFRTGSMSPTIPAGSVAVVQRIPASDIEVGDVVTVDRPGDLPVTHRVTSVAAGPSDGERVITMRGDANADEDPFPYTVSDARIVLFSVPAVANVIVAMSNPYVLGSITIGAAVLVGWAFWPREQRRKPAEVGT